MPVLSICIPTYNRADYLATTLESIVGQNGFAKVEIIISDNCSSDRTREVALEYVNKYPGQIIYNRNEKNLIDGNIPKVLSLGHGDFLKLQNDTAPLRPNALELMLETIQSAKDSGKTLPFFINGNISGTERVLCDNLDEFIAKTRYFNTWIAAFGIWREMLPQVLRILTATVKTRLTQSYALLTVVSQGWKVLVDPAVLFDSITPKKKGGYNVAEVFGRNYNNILQHFNSKKALSDKAYEKAKKDLVPFINYYYFDPNKEFAFDKNGYLKWMLPLYWNKLYFYLYFVHAIWSDLRARRKRLSRLIRGKNK